MHTLAESPRDLVILAPETGKPIQATDEDRRFFEGVSHISLPSASTLSLRAEFPSLALDASPWR